MMHNRKLRPEPTKSTINWFMCLTYTVGIDLRRTLKKILSFWKGSLRYIETSSTDLPVQSPRAISRFC